MADHTCVVVGCMRPVIARGWCTKHYQQWQKGRTPRSDVLVSLPGERWLPIPGYEQLYLASSLGRIWSLRRSRTMLQGPNGDGYLQVSLFRDGTRKTCRVHQLVAAAHLGPRPPGKIVCHNDDIKIHNVAENLRYDTHQANRLDIVKGGRDFNASKTVCSQGHAFDEANTHIGPDGRRVCRKCHRDREREQRPIRRALDPLGVRERARLRQISYRERNRDRVNEARRLARARKRTDQVPGDGG